MTKLGSILDQIDSGAVLLPEFQRGYVWNRDQVRGLMRSLYLGYPVGALLIWETEPSAADIRGAIDGVAGVKQLLLDGQQRITTLYGVARGRAPSFFEGDAAAFRGLRFHLEQETFEFYAPTKMKDDPLWVDVTELLQKGLEPHIERLSTNPSTQMSFATYIARLNRLHALTEREFHAEKITGNDKTIEHVVDIFNKVNSGGTKLSKGDLALAKICADWPEARATMRKHLAGWAGAGYNFSLDWFLRNVNAVATGKAPFEALEGVTPQTFQGAMSDAVKYVGGFLDLAAARLGLDHDRVFMGRYAVPVISRIQHLNGGTLGDTGTQDRLLYWYIHAALWGRFTGSTESVLTRDYDVAQGQGVDGLITELERWRGGNLTVSPHDFKAFGRGSRFYPLLYLLTRVGGARDFGTGLPLKQQLLGHLASLQVHHIFPKAQLYRHGYSRGEVNAVANLCFLTQQTNLAVGQRPPIDYFVETEGAHPGALASQWIPDDPTLWRIDRYPDFLEARRELLAKAANEFLQGLRSAQLPPSEAPLPRISVEDSPETDEEFAVVATLVGHLRELGVVPPALDVEIADPETGKVLAVAEAFWERGLQPGLGEPVVLELDPVETNLARTQELGYRVFTTTESLLGFARRRSQEAAGDVDESDRAGGHDQTPEPPVTSSPTSDQDVRRMFDGAMQDVYVLAKKEAGYNATYYLEMLHRHGGLETARRLLASGTVSDGFSALWERGRLDLTVENVVLRPEFEHLFTDEERETAKTRLKEYGLDVG
jgi:hypothetical protein